MSNKQNIKIVESFVSDDLSAMENAYETVYGTVLEAMINGTAKEAKEQFCEFYEKEERLAEIVGVMDSADGEEDQAGAAQYWFGQIKALADLLSEYAAQEQERQHFLELSKRSKYLNTCLVVINKHPRISGTELKRQLQMKDSNFSNFVKRMEPYQLFYVIRSGNTKYYMLSPQGRRYLRENTALQQKTDSRRLYHEEFLICLLRYLAGELKESERPSAANVILQTNLHENKGSALIGNSRMVKQAIKLVFRASEYRQRQRLWAILSGSKSYHLDGRTSYMDASSLKESQDYKFETYQGRPL